MGNSCLVKTIANINVPPKKRKFLALWCLEKGRVVRPAAPRHHEHLPHSPFQRLHGAAFCRVAVCPAVLLLWSHPVSWFVWVVLLSAVRSVVRALVVGATRAVVPVLCLHSLNK